MEKLALFICFYLYSLVLQEPTPDSGLAIGAESPAFSPQHAWGPDRGSHACPMCKYGFGYGVLVFVNSDEHWLEVEELTCLVEQESFRRKKRKQHFKGYLIDCNPGRLSVAALEQKLVDLGQKCEVREMAIAYVPSLRDRPSEMFLNKISPEAFNTLIVFKNRTIVDKFVNMRPTRENISLLLAALDKAGGK